MHTRSTYAAIRSAANTPEAKLQYVHFALQNGTEIYTPSERSKPNLRPNCFTRLSPSLSP